MSQTTGVLGLLRRLHGNRDNVFIDLTPLTAEERELVFEMKESEGWKLFIDKVFTRQQYGLAMQCTKPSDNLPYQQGMYAGFRFFRELVEQASTRESTDEAE